MVTARYRCTVCNYIYDEGREGTRFQDLPGSWRCPVCGATKSAFILLPAKPGEGEKTTAVETTVSDVLIEQMSEWGVEYVFGIPGTSSLGVVDAIRRSGKVKYVLVRHEQTAAFMASAYGKITGGVAACLTIAGPGATNLATGLFDAKLDRAPVLALTGQVGRKHIGTGAPQEIDQQSFFDSISVYNKVLMSKEQTVSLVTLALKSALVGRGVAHIAIPNDVQKEPCRARIIPFRGSLPETALTQSQKMIERGASLVDGASRPVIVAGFGAMGQGEEVLALAKKITAPIVTTFRAKGIVDEGEELSVGSHGGIGSTAATELVRAADLMIVIGASFSSLTMLPEKRTLQIDIDPMMIGRRYPVELGLWGNSSELVPRLREAVSGRSDAAYLEEIRRLKKEWEELLAGEVDAVSRPLRPQYIIRVLNEKIAPDAVISLDVGEHCWWFGRNFAMRGTQKMILSGLLGSMGSGLPGSMAAHLALPRRQNVCITGDGGFAMVMSDFLTVVRDGMPIKVFIFNNRQLGMITQEQFIEKYPIWQTELHNPDFAEYARICGGHGIKVTEPGDLPAAVDEALSFEGAVIVDIDTDPKRFTKPSAERIP